MSLESSGSPKEFGPDGLPQVHTVVECDAPMHCAHSEKEPAPRHCGPIRPRSCFGQPESGPSSQFSDSLDQPGPVEQVRPRLDRTTSSQARSGQARPNQARPNQTIPDQTRSGPNQGMTRTMIVSQARTLKLPGPDTN